MSDVTKSCRDLKELDADTKRATEILLEECKRQGLNILITETYRSQARQDYLYAQGRTRPGAIVTNTKQSIHTSRRAVDFCKNVKGQEYSDSNFFKNVAAIAKAIGFEWGGNFSTFKDTPHLQLAVGKKPVDIGFNRKYKDAVDKLAAEGIITQMPVWWPKVNLNNAEYLIKSFGNKVFGKHTYNESVQKLADTKISISPHVWLNRTHTEDNLKMLVINMANYLK